MTGARDHQHLLADHDRIVPGEIDGNWLGGPSRVSIDHGCLEAAVPAGRHNPGLVEADEAVRSAPVRAHTFSGHRNVLATDCDDYLLLAAGYDPTVDWHAEFATLVQQRIALEIHYISPYEEDTDGPLAYVRAGGRRPDSPS